MIIQFVTLIIASFPLYLLYIHFKWLAQDKRIGVKGPKCLPLLGNLHQLWGYILKLTAHKRMVEMFDEYGDTFRLRFGPKLLILTRDVKIIEGIVNNPKFEKSHDYKLYEPWLGNGILLSAGAKWHKMRKLLTPAFHFQILEQFIPIYEEHGKIFVQKLRNLSTDQVIDVVPWFHAYTLDVISETSMGYKLNAQTDPSSKFVRVNKELLDTIILRFYNPLYKNDWIWKMTKYYKRVSECITYFHEFVDTIINNRRDQLISENSVKFEERKRPALLDILLLSTIDGRPLTNKEIQDEVNSFMLAGHETTGTTLGFLAYVLAKYPDVQNQVYEEIKVNGLFDPDEKLTIRKINSLSYFETVIKETLRMYPILGGAHKQCPEDIKIGGILIPANTIISTSIASSHLYAKNFENPLKFDPSRWNDEISASERNPYAYQPFSSGLRNCIGQKFALLEMKTIMIEILREFKIALGYENFEVDLKHGSLLFSANGVQVKFIKRTE
uniref:CSON009392 protein n=1 Tax=Culicoides sonorensis TaxID=179676 RepID=A0A336KFI5_CULSO